MILPDALLSDDNATESVETILKTLSQVVKWMCEAPARVWNLKGKGKIAVGYDADLVLVDLGREHEIRNEDQLTKSGWSPWHGVKLKGQPIHTIVGGQTVYQDGHVVEHVRGKEALFDR